MLKVRCSMYKLFSRSTPGKKGENQGRKHKRNCEMKACDKRGERSNKILSTFISHAVCRASYTHYGMEEGKSPFCIWENRGSDNLMNQSGVS